MTDVIDEVTGGDLNDLRLAAAALVEVQNIYTKHAGELAYLPDADAETYGRTHQWWAYVVGELEAALRGTGERLNIGAQALLDAITAYAHCDGDNAKALTEAGEGYLSILGDPDKAGDPLPTVVVLDEKTLPGPDFTDKPHGWEDNHG